MEVDKYQELQGLMRKLEAREIALESKLKELMKEKKEIEGKIGEKFQTVEMAKEALQKAEEDLRAKMEALEPEVRTLLESLEDKDD